MSDFDLDEPDADDGDTLLRTYLTFAIAGEQYAIPVRHVTEIVRLPKIFAVPDVARHVRGVINLRGKVIPLLDVRARFGLADRPYDDRTVVVVVELDGAPTGLIVDEIHGIAELPADAIEPAQQIARSVTEPLVTGLCRRGDSVSFMLAVERLITQAPPADAAR